MSKKVKSDMKISINIPDQKIFSHITNAYGLVCQYRTANKVPHESMENWLLRLAVEGCNALYKFHDEQVKQANKSAEVVDETKKASE